MSRAALVVDVREGAFLHSFPGILEELRAKGAPVTLLFFEAADEALKRRFSETRRPHPMLESVGTLEHAIRAEREALAPLRERADRILDTTRFNAHELRKFLKAAFGSPTAQSPPYQEVIPFGPLDEPLNGQPRRKRLTDAAAAYQAIPAAGTPLFETILRANTEMQKRWRPDAVTLIVVLTDGHDRDSAYAMPKQQFLSKLNAARDPKKPLPIHSIAYGADADLPTLTELSKSTGGVAAQSTDPADLASAMAKIFLAARRAQI